MPEIPIVQLLDGFPALFVDGKPFLALAGEVHNSSSSSPAYMERAVWPNLEGLHLNTLLVPVSWEQIEPVKDQFDFTVIDALVEQAKNRNIRLVVLWFGLWKNAGSSYIPGWMKKDRKTYFRAQRHDGTTINTISPFCEAAVERDARAFAAFMAHLRETDADHTVIAIQVENEIGLRIERDHCPIAEKTFRQPVPQELAKALGVSGTWEEAFGRDAGESMMAWAFASAVEKIASSGKAELDLPCYCNVWVEQPPYRAGTYPSGGPVIKVQPIWKATAPSLFGFGPDLYVNYAPEMLDAYSANGNPLFIPEFRKDAQAATYLLYAVAGCNAICVSPFGVEDIQMDPDKLEKMPRSLLISLDIDGSAVNVTGTAPFLAESYRLLGNMWELILEYRGSGRIKAFVYRNDDKTKQILSFTKYDVQVNYSRQQENVPGSGGFIIELNDDEFLVVGTRFSFQFVPKLGEPCEIDIITYEEGEWCCGRWQRGRILNGDERRLKVEEMPTVRKVEVYKHIN